MNIWKSLLECAAGRRDAGVFGALLTSLPSVGRCLLRRAPSAARDEVEFWARYFDNVQYHPGRFLYPIQCGDGVLSLCTMNDVIFHTRCQTLHRTSGPAVEDAYENCVWRLFGTLHRVGGPAVQFRPVSRQSDPWWVQIWYHDGELHRCDVLCTHRACDYGTCVENCIATTGRRWSVLPIVEFLPNGTVTDGVTAPTAALP